MLSFKNITFGYPEDKDELIQNLSFEVQEGQFVSLIGASGCGKSTIFRLINQLEKPSLGEIFVDGKEVNSSQDKTIPRGYCGYMPQRDTLLPWRTIGENLALPMEIQKVSKQNIQDRTQKILQELDLLSYKDGMPKSLSGGMRQRIAFARTLLTGGKLLLLDEHFSALDSLTRIDLQEWLVREWEKRQNTILFITHDVEEAVFLSDYIFVMNVAPVTELEKYKIDLPHPRTRADLKRPEIVKLKEELIEKLRQEKNFHER